jgi:tetratricopeptide (TPR) repeat protein
MVTIHGLEYLGTALFFGPRPVETALVQCTQLLAEHEGDRASEANIVAWQGGLEAMRCRFDVGRALVERARAIYEDLGLENAVIDICGRVLGTIEMLSLRPDKAEEALRASCELAQRLGQTPLLATRAGALAAALYEQKRYSEAETWTDLARKSAGADDLDAALSWQPIQARLLAERGALPQAVELARGAVQSARRTDSLNRQADCLIALADVLRTAGDEANASTVTEEAVRLYEAKGNLVSVQQARGLLPDAVLTE